MSFSGRATARAVPTAFNGYPLHPLLIAPALVGIRRPTSLSEIGVFLLPEVLFPGVKGTERELVELLSSLSRDDALFHAARLNTLISGPGDFDAKGRQQLALNQLCTKKQINQINAFIRSRGNAAGQVSIFFRGQILEFMRWVAKFCRNLDGDGQTFNAPDQREKFLKGLLIASVLWGKRVFDGKLSVGSNVSESRLRALGAFRKGAEESNLGPHLGVALGRGKALFVDHFPRRYSEFADVFRRATGLNVDEYRACVASLSVYTLFNHKDGPLFLTQSVGAATALRDVFPAYFNLEAQTPGELARSLWDDFQQRGYRALRERPIMVANDGRAIILDPTFFAEKVSIGPVFHLLKGMSQKQGDDILGRFGKAFEDYATDILRRMYPSRPPLVDRTAFGLKGKDAKGFEFEIDALMLDAREAVLFEVKAAWLREDAVVDGAHETLLRDIRKKYGVEPGSKKHGKGVAQLARSIGAIARGEWSGPNREFAEMKVLYPVLLVHDTRLDAPGIGAFLESEFKASLGSSVAGKIVAPLTIMTIQDLESLESSIEGFSLVELLPAYTRECPDRMQSLHNYIVFSDYGRRTIPSRYLMESSSEILTVLERELFPKTNSTPEPSKLAQA
jgi:hypothetical protein